MRRNFVCTLRIRLAFLFYFLECYFFKEHGKKMCGGGGYGNSYIGIGR